MFIDGRLKDPAILTWAAGLGPQAGAERRAVRDAVFSRSEGLSEPYITAWRCVIEAWRDGTADDPDMTAFEIKAAIARGVDPRLFLDAIVGLAAPRLRVRARSPLSAAPRGKPTEVGHLLTIDFEPDHHVKLDDIGLEGCTDRRVWDELLDRAEGVLFSGLHLSERLGQTWSANWITRVYPVEGEGEEDPDAFRGSFMPITRLVAAALSRLAAVDPDAAAIRANGLAARRWPIARRLWAFAAFDPAIVSGKSLGEWLAMLSDEEVWNAYQFPELVELRVRRYGEIPSPERRSFERRLRRGPPARLFRRDIGRAQRAERRIGDAFAELRRLQHSGADLTPASAAWLENHAHLENAREPDALYDKGDNFRQSSSGPGLDLSRAEVFAELDAALTEHPYTDGRAALDTVAAHWDSIFHRIQSDTALLVHGRLVGALAFSLRDRLGAVDQNESEADNTTRVSAFVDLLDQIPDSARPTAAPGVSYWFSSAVERLPGDVRLPPLWLAYWPFAALVTNTSERAEDDGVFDPAPNEQLASEASNSAVGRMMTAYFRLLPSGEAWRQAFDDPNLARARDVILSTKGEAGRQGLYRLLLEVRFLNHVDSRWTQSRLLEPLGERDGVAPELWDAISRIDLLVPEALAQIATEMARRITDVRLPMEVRARLAERLVLPVAIALRDGGEPPVSLESVQQLLRLGGVEVRRACARGLTRWVEAGNPPSAHFEQGVLPILEGGWPKDQSLQAPEIADAFAPLPAATETAFSEAVEALVDLLVPFDVWSLWEYRIYQKEDDGQRELKIPRNEQEARALLKLLDLTIGDEDDAIIPHDLDLALSGIVAHWRQGTQDRRFGRLAAFARR